VTTTDSSNQVLASTFEAGDKFIYTVFAVPVADNFIIVPSAFVS